MQWGTRTYKFNKYVVAWRIVYFEMRKRRSLKPLKLMWKKTWYGDKWPYRVISNLPDYVDFCRMNGIAAVVIPDEELA